MATELGVAYLSVVASTGGLAKDIERQMGGVGSSAGKKLGGGIMGGVKSAIGPLAAVAGAAAGLGAVSNFLRSSNDEARESQKVNRVTAQIIKATGKAAGLTAGQVGDLATAISSKTGVDDEAVQASANLLLTFKKVRNEAGEGGKIFDRATAAAQDLAAAGFGDANSAAKMLGKALNDPAKGMTALSRAGVTFTQEQKDQVASMLKANNVLGAQKLIMKEVESQVGGVAAATATATQKMGVKWSNFKEAIGTAFVIPAMDAIATKVSPVIDWLTASVPKVQAFFKSLSGSGVGVGAIAGIATAFSPVGLAMKTIMPILPQLMAAFGQLGGQLLSILMPALASVAPVVQQVVGALAGGLQQVILALLPVLLQIASAVLPVIAQVIAAAVPIVTQLVQAFLPLIPMLTGLVTSLLPPIATLITGLMTAVSPLIGAIVGLVQAFMPIIGVITQLIAQLLPPLVAFIQALVPPIVAVVAQIAQALMPVFDAVGQLIQALMPVIIELTGVITSIISAVMPVVSAILGALIPVLGTVIGWIAKVVTAIVRFVADGIKSIGSWAKGISDGISKAVQFFMDLPGKIGEVFKGAATWLVDSGANLLKGLWNGISDTVGWLKDQIGNAMKGVIDSVKNAFGIKSPSKVFRKIGTQLTAGLAAGVTTSTGSATSAISKMAKLVTETAAKAVGKSAKKQAKAAAKAANALLNYQKSGKTGTLTGIAAQREALADRIKDANDALADQISARNQMRDSVASSISGELDLASALTSGGSQQTSVIGGATVVSTTRTSGFASIAAHVAGLAAKAKAFAGRLKSLIQAGYPAGLVQEVAGLGTANGISVADALLSASSADQGSLISDFSSLMSWSSEAGSYVADQMYGVGIAAQQGIVNGLLSDDAKLVEAAEAVATKLTDAVKKKLGIKSPSTVFRDEVGLMVAKGAAQGITKGQSIVAAAGRGLIGPLDNASFGARAEADRPVVMDGRIIAWIKQTATGAARLVLADESLNAQVAMA